MTGNRSGATSRHYGFGIELQQNRWNMGEVALRQGQRDTSLEVDHIVAFDLWQSKLQILRRVTD